MAKYKVANSSSIEHIPGEIEEKWETKRSMKTFTPMSKAPMGGSHSRAGQFSIYNYLRYQKYPEGASKLEKNSLRRRSKYFMLQSEDLYYIGGGELKQFNPCK